MGVQTVERIAEGTGNVDRGRHLSDTSKDPRGVLGIGFLSHVWCRVQIDCDHSGHDYYGSAIRMASPKRTSIEIRINSDQVASVQKVIGIGRIAEMIFGKPFCGPALIDLKPSPPSRTIVL